MSRASPLIAGSAGATSRASGTPAFSKRCSTSATAASTAAAGRHPSPAGASPARQAEQPADHLVDPLDLIEDRLQPPPRPVVVGARGPAAPRAPAITPERRRDLVRHADGQRPQRRHPAGPLQPLVAPLLQRGDRQLALEQQLLALLPHARSRRTPAPARRRPTRCRRAAATPRARDRAAAGRWRPRRSPSAPTAPASTRASPAQAVRVGSPSCAASGRESRATVVAARERLGDRPAPRPRARPAPRKSAGAGPPHQHDRVGRTRDRVQLVQHLPRIARRPRRAPPRRARAPASPARPRSRQRPRRLAVGVPRRQHRDRGDRRDHRRHQACVSSR